MYCLISARSRNASSGFTIIHSQSLHHINTAADLSMMTSTFSTPGEPGIEEDSAELADVDGVELDAHSESLFKETNQEFENDELESNSDDDHQRPTAKRPLIEEEEDDDDDDDAQETSEIKYSLHSLSTLALLSNLSAY